jgi:hypothetical protein
VTRANAGARFHPSPIEIIGENAEIQILQARRLRVGKLRTLSIEDTTKFWQASSSRPLSAEDARQAIESVTGFFATLQRWAAADPPVKKSQAQQEAA